MNKRTILNLLKYALAFGLLAWVVASNWAPESGRGLSYVWQRHLVEGQPIEAGYLVAAVGLFAMALVLTLLRWYVLVRAQDLPIGVIEAIRLGLVGFFFSTFLPGSVGGDIVKAAALARRQSRRTVAVATVLMDRLIALWGLIWFVAILGAVFWLAGMLDGDQAEKSKSIVTTAGAIVAASLLVWLLLGLLPERRAEIFAGRLTKLPKVGGSAAEFWRAVWMYRCRQGSVAAALLLSWVGFIGFVGCFYCCSRALWDGDPSNPLPSLTEHFLIIPIGMVIAAVPLFPGGAGISELGFGGLYKLFGSHPANGVLASLVQRVLTWSLALIGYVVSFWLRSDGTEMGEPRPNSAVIAHGEPVVQARAGTFTTK